MEKQQTSFYYGMLLASLLLLILATNVLWIVIDQRQPTWDSAEHSQQSVLFSEYLQHLQFQAIGEYDTIFPPLATLLSGGLFLLAGKHVDIPQFSLIFWIIVLMISTYSIGYHLFQQKNAAMFAAILVMLYPVMTHFSRTFSLDFPLAALVTATFAALIKTEYFYVRKWSLVFGLCFAAALLTQWTAIIFLFAPCMYFALLSMQNAHKEYAWKRSTINIFFILLIISLLAGPWYILHIGTIATSAQHISSQILSVSGDPIFSWSNILFYIRESIQGMSWILSVFMLFGIIELIRQKQRSIWFIVLWIIFPYCIFTFALYIKDIQLLLPLFPAFALFTAGVFVGMKYEWRAISIIGIMIITLFFWFETSWGLRVLPGHIYTVLFLNNQYGYSPETAHLTAPTQNSPLFPKVVRTLQAHSKQYSFEDNQIRIAVVPNTSMLNMQQLQYYSRLEGFESINQPLTIDYTPSIDVRSKEWRQALYSADYIITKTGDQGANVSGPYVEEVRNEEEKKDSLFKKFTLVQEWKNHDKQAESYTLRLYYNPKKL